MVLSTAATIGFMSTAPEMPVQPSVFGVFVSGVVFLLGLAACRPWRTEETGPQGSI
jgi:hypothetical protein